MATNTFNGYFSKPAVGGDTDTWGSTLNSNWDTVDSVLAGDREITALAIGTTSSSIPLTCNAASATNIAASFSGYVGIGTTSPTEKLEVSSATGSTNIDPTVVRISTTTSAGTWDNNSLWGALQFYSADASDGGAKTQAQIGANTAATTGGISDLTFSLAEVSSGTLTERMRIDSAGNVGIGTSSPTSPLDIRGSVNSNLDLAVYNQFDDDDEVAPNPSARLYLSAASNNAYLEAHGAPEDSAGLHKVDLGSSAAGSFLTFSPSGAEHMRIDASGNVGIGTTNPSTKLHVDGGDLKITSDSDTTGEGDGIPSILFGELTGGSAHAQISYHGDDKTNDDNYLGLGVFDPTQSSADTLAEQKLQNTLAITRGGKVGIGTISPNEQLHLTNNLKVDGVIRSATFDSGESTTVNVLCDDAGEAKLNLMGGNQGTGRLYVGQSSTHGGGIEYNGDSTPVTSGGGSDKIVLFRRDNGTDHWTARNSYSSNDWEFRGKVTADELAGTLAQSIFNQIYPVGAVYISTSATSPQTLFGGTWTAIGGGRVLQTVSGTTPAAGANYGSNTRAISTSNLPSHSHSFTDYTFQESVAHGGVTTAGLSQGLGSGDSDSDNYPARPRSATTGTTGSGTNFDVRQASYGVYMWKRATLA